jgi:hypothetical protein
MTESQPIYTCQICGADKGGSFCKVCNAETPSKIALTLADTIVVHDFLQATLKGPRKNKFIIKSHSGWKESGDEILPDGVEITRSIDHEHDWYDEVVKKSGTDIIIHECHEKLSEHHKKKK